MSSRRVVIFSTTFFPDPQVAAIRMTQFARHLPEFGWTPTIACRHYGVHATPAELHAQVHPSVSIHYLNFADGIPPASQALNEPRISFGGSGFRARAQTLATHLMDGWVIPDVGKYFWNQVQDHALDFLRSIEPDVFITSSPAHSIHLLGLWLRDQVDIPWVADFRDPYVIDRRFMPRGLAKIRTGAHVDLESRVYDRAAAIIHAIPVHGRWARRHYAGARDKIAVIENGCPTDMVPSQRSSVPGTPRTISVIGSIDANKTVLLARAVAALREQTGENVRLSIIGRRPKFLEEIRQILGNALHVSGYVSHHEAMVEASQADVLVSCLTRERAKSLQLTSKLFEFIAVGCPVIHINPTRPDRRIIRSLSWVREVKAPTLQMLVDVLRESLHGDSAPPAEVAAFRVKYSRQTQSQKLAEVLDRVAPQRTTVDQESRVVGFHSQALMTPMSPTTKGS